MPPPLNGAPSAITVTTSWSRVRRSTAAVTAFVGPYLHGPVGWTPIGRPFDLETIEAGAPIVVQGVAALSASEQARLLVWLNEPSERR